MNNSCKTQFKEHTACQTASRDSSVDYTLWHLSLILRDIAEGSRNAQKDEADNKDVDSNFEQLRTEYGKLRGDNEEDKD